MTEAAPANVVAMPHGRVPPHSLDAERSLLGGLLLDGTAIDDVLLVVRGADFYRDAHRKIFEAMVDVTQRNVRIDRVSVKDALVRVGAFEAVGGDDYVDLLDQIVPTAANLAYYAKIIADKSLQRRIIETASAIVQLGYEQHGDVAEYADQSEAKMFEVRTAAAAAEFTHIGEMIKPVFMDIEARAQRDTTLVGVPSGLEKLDEMTNGFKRENLVIIAARPGMGKTALAGDIALAVAKNGGGVGFFSLEMSREELTTRMLATMAKVNSKNIESGRLSPAEWGRLAGAANKLQALPIHFFAKDEVSASEIRARGRRLSAQLSGTKTPLAMIIVDYLQLMYLDESAERRDVAIGRNTRQLKGLAKQLQVPVLLLAQLNREVEKRPNKRPQMSDLRESGSIENDADLIIFVFREEEYKRTDENRGVAELIIGKQRSGPRGVVRVGFVAEYSSFQDLYGSTMKSLEQQNLALPKTPEREEPPPPGDEDAR